MWFAVSPSRLAGFVLLGLCLFWMSACNTEASRRRLLEAANKYHDSGKYKEASIIYRKLIQKDPLHGEAYYRLGKNELKLGRYSDALRALRRASELQPSNDDAHTQLGDLYLAIYSSDRERFKTIFREFSDLAEKLYARNPNSFAAVRMKGLQAAVEGRHDEAIEFFQRALEISGGDRGVELALVQSISQAGRPQEAEKLAWKFIEANKIYAPLYNFVYLLRLRDGQPDEAENVLRRKIENNPDQWQPLVELAAHQLRFRKTDQAHATIARIVADESRFPNGPMIAGDFYLRSGFFDLAEQAYKKGLERSRQRRLYEKKLVEAMLVQGRKREALEITERLLQEDGDDAQAQALRAMLRLQGATRADLEAAISELEALLPKLPDNAVIRFNLGEAYLAQGKLDQAVVQLQEASRIRPGYAPPRLLLARIHLEKREFPRALALSEDVLRLAPKWKDARLLRLAALLGQGDLKAVRAGSQELLADFPNLNDALYLLATVDFLEKNYAEAEKGFRKLATASPPDRRGVAGLAEVALATGRPKDAVRLMEERIQRGEDVQASRLQLALVAVRSQDYDRAIVELKNLVKESPGSAELLARLGEVYRMAGKRAEAEQTFESARKLDPRNQVALLQLAMIYEETGRRPQAKPLYEELLKVAPDHPVVLNNYAYLLAEGGVELDQALTYAQRARQRLPQNEEIADTLGWIYIKKNLSDEAIKIFSELLAKRPGHVTWRYHLATALAQKGNREQAKRELKLALENNPTREESARIKELLDRLG
jgi:tetratricopeptide (TPR) repeat protein